MITTRTTTIERLAWYLNWLGYAYCADCKHSLTIAAARVLSTPELRDRCDACGRLLRESVEVCDAAYTVEAVSCKIF